MSLPPRVSPTELANLWKISRTRVLQFVNEGKLKRGVDGNIDTQEALSFRAIQIQTYQSQVLEKAHGNRFKSGADAAPPTLNALAEGEIVGRDPLDITPQPEIDPLDIPAKAEAPQAPAAPSGMAEVLAQTNALADLKRRKLEAELERILLRKQKDAGEVISRHEVHKAGQGAGKLIGSILRNLPSEIASLFPDPDTRAEVRQKVQGRVEQIQQAVYSALKSAAGTEDDA